MLTPTFSHIKMTILAHPISIGILSLAVCQALFGALKVGQLLDYPAYVGAAVSWLHHQDPYSQYYANSLGEVNFIYPPGSIFTFIPFTLFAPHTGEIVFTIGSILMMLTALLIVAHKTLAPLTLDYKLLLVAFLIQTFPLKFNLTLGQVNLYVLGLSIIALYLIPQKPVLSSILLGLASSIKLFPLILLIPILLHRRYKVFFLTLMIILILNYLTGSLGHYLITILPRQLAVSSLPDPDYYNISLNASLFHLFKIYSNINLGLLLGVILLIFITLRRSSFFITSISLLAVSIIFPSNSWSHYFVFAYPLLLSAHAHPLAFIPLWLLLTFHLPHPNKEIFYHAPITGVQNLFIYAFILYGVLKNRLQRTELQR